MIFLTKIYSKLLAFCLKNKGKFIFILFYALGFPIFLLPSKVVNNDLYNNTVGSEIYQEEIRPILDPILGGAFRVFYRNLNNHQPYDFDARTILYIHASMDNNVTIDQMNSIVKSLEVFIGKIKGIDKFITNIYSNQYAKIEITFNSQYDKGGLPLMVEDIIIIKCQEWGGVNWEIFGVGNGFNNSVYKYPNFQVKIKGYNFDELERITHDVSFMLRRNDRIKNVNENSNLNFYEKSTNQMIVQFDPKSLSIVNNLKKLSRNLQIASGSTTPYLQMLINEKQVPISIVSNRSQIFSLYDLNNSIQYSNIDSSVSITLKRISKLSNEQTANSIIKENRQYVRILSCDYYGDHFFGKKYLEKILIEDFKFPLGYSAEIVEHLNFTDKILTKYLSFVFLIVAIFIVCSILFENFKLSLIVIFSVLFSNIGLFLSFGLSNIYFGEGGFMSILILSSVVSGTSIFFIKNFGSDDIIAQHIEQISLKVIFNNSKIIIMINFVFIFSLLPIIIFDQQSFFWRSLAIGLIGGLLFSFFNFLLVLPVLLINNRSIFAKAVQ
jgi:multidrug efflux pump subunit AcrB